MAALPWQTSAVPEVDAVVVGSGPNGLVAAVRLAEAGMRVVVLEAAERPGGGLRTEEATLPGFRHDVCSTVHALAPASPAFRALALEQDGLRFALPEAPVAHVLEDGGVVLPRDLDDAVRALGADGPVWRALVGTVAARGVDDVLAPLDRPRDPVGLLAFGARAVWPSELVARALLREERTRALLAGIAGHSVLPLSAPATTAYALVLGGLAHRTGWPVAVGGSQAIADALVARLRLHGGEVRTGTRVRSVADLPAARHVLLDLTPRQVLRITGDWLPARYRERLARFRYGPGVFKLDWALDGPVPWRDPEVARAATVHLGGGLDEIARSERDVARGRHPERPYVIAVQATVADPSRAPAGKHTLWAYCHVPPGSRVDLTAAIEGEIERAAPGFRDRILARASWDTAALEAHDANEVGGDIGGGAGDWRQLLTRPVAARRPWATPVDGLHLCSASTPPGGGVHGMSGWNAATDILRRT